MKTRVYLKYFVNDCSLRVSSSRSLQIKRFIYKSLDSLFFFIYTEKLREVQDRDGVCLKMPCTLLDAPSFQLVQQKYTKSEVLDIMRLLESNIA